MVPLAVTADAYGPPRRPRTEAKRARVQAYAGANRTYLMLMATCLLVSAVMNWVGFAVTEKQGKRASHIEAYLRRYLSVRPSISTRNRDGDALTSHRRPDSIGDEPDEWEMSESKQEDGDDDDHIKKGEEAVESEHGDNTEDDDDDDIEESEGNGTGDGDEAEREENEEEEEEEENGNSDDENTADTDGPSRPVEDGGPPPDEDGGGWNRAATVLPENDENSDEERRPMAVEHGGPPAIDGREASSSNNTEHRIGGLSCKKFGGPSDRIAKEMVYWKDIPTDSQFVSPLRAKGSEGATRYMTFEPDGGGWNNIRMAMETVVSLAHAMGRTLVLPPDQRMYLIGKNGYHASFSHFYHLESLSEEHAGLTIVSMKDFLEKEAMAGQLIDKRSRRPSFPPGNRTDWNGESGQGMKVLHEWLRNVLHVPQWKPDQCVVAIPSARGSDATSALEEAHKQIKEEVFHGAADAPVPVDGPLKERMREILNGRDLCIYDEAMQEEPVVHFVSAHKLGLRLLVHFYTFLFFEDPRWDSWNKRFVRDHLRYVDELQCAAARVVHAIRDRARKRQLGSKRINATTGTRTISTFMSMHIRRNEFQYKDMFLSADQLYHASKEELAEGSTVFVATDEKDRGFFEPIQEHYDLCFLDDFKHLFEGLNENLYGMLDQLVASRGDKFFGTYYSTFTGFINRMRGYHHADKAMLKGYEDDGAIESYFFAPETRRYDMAKFKPPTPPYWAREFPISWRDIDKGIEEISSIGASKKKTKTQTTPAIM